MTVFFGVFSDSIEVRMKGFFNRAFSTIVENITIDGLENLDDLEVCFLH